MHTFRQSISDLLTTVSESRDKVQKEKDIAGRRKSMIALERKKLQQTDGVNKLINEGVF